MVEPSPASEGVLGVIQAARLLPVLVVEDASSAAPLAGALIAGGVRCVEVTLRTPAALAALTTMASDERLVVGAGTVVNVGQVDAAVAAGARFLVSPGFSPAVVRRCGQLHVPIFPGVASPTDIMAAADAGLDVVKLFPAELLGGVAMIAALAAPFPGLRFIPTGGITAANLPSYLAHPAVLAVGGSWMVAPALIAAGRWSDISSLTAAAVARTGG